MDVEPVTNFCAIGTGAYTAEPALHAREQAFNANLDQTLYNVYEAKKIGETSRAVGKKTITLVVHPASTEDPGVVRIQYLSAVGEKDLQKRFKKYGPRPIPPFPGLPEGSLLDTSSIRGKAGTA